MKIKDNFKIRKIAGENMLICQGQTHSDLTRIITLNDTGVYLWENLVGKDFTSEDAAALLVGEYDVDQAVALGDARKFLDKLIEAGVIE